MANLICAAKSGSDWTTKDLDSYNIHLNQLEPLEFFELPALPEPAVDQELLMHLNADEMQQDRNAELINLLNLAMITEESAVVDFTFELFKLTGYVRRHRVAQRRKDLPLFICGEWRHAKTNVCIVDQQQNDILLVVQEDTRLKYRKPVDIEKRKIIHL
ncbi:hypothetical protein BJ165DRAFT_1337968 [Panaeolus papilionaceus]|nr:hypothetical protein BJ165DRAFT_1337968 [Panaeolus papilionaceus]